MKILQPEELLRQVQWNGDGLAPVVVVEFGSGRLLMQAWVSPPALREAVETGRGVYWSRSRREIWRKGETSGHVQRLRELYLDCDADSLAYAVEQTGFCCHENKPSCFRLVWADADSAQAGQIPGAELDTLTQLSGQVLQRWEEGGAQDSYVASLRKAGAEAVAGKVLEESHELVQAATGESDERVLAEAADLWFHSLVLLRSRGLDHAGVLRELRRRLGRSGLEEKRSRGDNGR